MIDYWTKWMKVFPTIEDLAKATPEVRTALNIIMRYCHFSGLPAFSVLAIADPRQRVNEMWAGLGYYRRARLLHSCAQAIVNQHKGKIPATAAELEDLPGIGKYTAGAIASIAFNQAVPLLDGNVTRVVARLRSVGFAAKGNDSVKHFWRLAAALVDPIRPGDLNQALMELGATVCTPKEPRCGSCPVNNYCSALGEVKGRSLPAPQEQTERCSACTATEPTKTVRTCF